jgi:hypothetical protein
LAWAIKARSDRRRDASAKKAEDDLRSEIRRAVLSSLNQEYILSHIASVLHDRLGFERVWLGTMEGDMLEGRMARSGDLP